MIPQRKRRRDAGVTLLEVLVVLGIIAMVTTVVAPRVLDNFGRAKGQTATVQMAQVKGALQIFYLDVGRFPTEAEGLQALTSAPAGVQNWAGPYIDAEALQDPWGRGYLYRLPGEQDPFDLFTYGRDGQPGGTKEDADKYL